MKWISKFLFWLSLAYLLMIPVSLAMTAGAYGALTASGAPTASVAASMVNSVISNLYHAGLLLGLSRVIALLEKLAERRDEETV